MPSLERRSSKTGGGAASATSAGAGSSAKVDIPRLEVPLDDDDYRFTRSFRVGHGDADEDAAALAFFEEYGFVVARDIIDADATKATRDEMWSYLESTVEGFSRADKESWKLWGSRGFGMPHGREPVYSKQFLRNRQSPALHKLCSMVLGDEDVVVNHDRWAIYRPTQGVSFASGTADAEEWRTRLSLHVDFQPWHYASDAACIRDEMDGLRYGDPADLYRENNAITKSMGRQVQGVLNLRDNLEEDGGFIIVPGFHKVFDEWIASQGDMPETMHDHRSFSMSHDADLVSRAVRITMRAGSCVVWDQRCAHGSRPNKSSNFRAASFFRMFPARLMTRERAEARAAAVARLVRESGFDDEVTPTGRVVFGFNHSRDARRKGRTERVHSEHSGGSAESVTEAVSASASGAGVAADPVALEVARTDAVASAAATRSSAE